MTHGSDVRFLQMSTADPKQPPIGSVQGDNSYLRKFCFGGRGLSLELPLPGLLEPLLKYLPLPYEEPLSWVRDCDGRKRFSLEDEENLLSRRDGGLRRSLLEEDGLNCDF